MAPPPPKAAPPPSLGPKEMYLVAYNALCCLGWAYVLALGVPSLYASFAAARAGGAAFLAALQTAGAALYRATPATAGWSDEASPSLASALNLVQGAAALEVVHAAAGLVRSPVLVTMLQVGSRLVALHMVGASPRAQSQWGAALMILSWALVEVPRYLFYVAALVTGDATKGTPYPLFWLRYSLFAVLYPTGISGELSVFISASRCATFLGLLGAGRESVVYWYAMAFPIIYAPGALPMVLNMAGNRKRAFKKRFARPPPPPVSREEKPRHSGVALRVSSLTWPCQHSRAARAGLARHRHQGQRRGGPGVHPHGEGVAGGRARGGGSHPRGGGPRGAEVALRVRPAPRPDGGGAVQVPRGRAQGGWQRLVAATTAAVGRGDRPRPCARREMASPVRWGGRSPLVSR